MVRGSGDPVTARELVAAHPESQQRVRDLYLEDLAQRGRVKQLAAAAQTLQAADRGALLLAIHGRPLAALELAATARLHTPELVCARALACYRGGRGRISRSASSSRISRRPRSSRRRARAVSRGRTSTWLIATRATCGRRSPRSPGASPGSSGSRSPRRTMPSRTSPSIAGAEAVVRRLGRGLPGATVYLAGEFERIDKPAIARGRRARRRARRERAVPRHRLLRRTATAASSRPIAQLERQGARRLRRRRRLEGLRVPALRKPYRIAILAPDVDRRGPGRGLRARGRAGPVDRAASSAASATPGSRSTTRSRRRCGRTTATSRRRTRRLRCDDRRSVLGVDAARRADLARAHARRGQAGVVRLHSTAEDGGNVRRDSGAGARDRRSDAAGARGVAAARESRCAAAAVRGRSRATTCSPWCA